MKQLVLDSIEQLIRKRERYFRQIAFHGRSFENWLTMELCVALADDQRQRVNAEKVYYLPPYNLDFDKCEGDQLSTCSSDRLDLAFMLNSSDEKVAVEIKVAHRRTQAKYRWDCIKDINGKLPAAVNFDRRLFMLVVASTLGIDDFQKDSEWQPWLASIFEGHEPMIRAFDIEGGSLHVYLLEVGAKSSWNPE